MAFWPPVKNGRGFGHMVWTLWQLAPPWPDCYGSLIIVTAAKKRTERRPDDLSEVRF